MLAEHWWGNTVVDKFDVSTKEKTKFDLFGLLLRVRRIKFELEKERFFFRHIQFHAPTNKRNLLQFYTKYHIKFITYQKEYSTFMKRLLSNVPYKLSPTKSICSSVIQRWQVSTKISMDVFWIDGKEGWGKFTEFLKITIFFLTQCLCRSASS